MVLSGAALLVATTWDELLLLAAWVRPSSGAAGAGAWVLALCIGSSLLFSAFYGAYGRRALREARFLSFAAGLLVCLTAALPLWRVLTVMGPGTSAGPAGRNAYGPMALVVAYYLVVGGCTARVWLAWWRHIR